MGGCPFDVGDVVVCVDARPKWIIAEPAISAFGRLRAGKAYRVSRIGENEYGKIGIDIGVRNSDLWVGYGDVWPPQCFRKIDDGVTESFLHQMRSIGKRKPVLA